MDGLGHEDILWKLIKDYGINIQLNRARKQLFKLQGHGEAIMQNEKETVITVLALATSYTTQTADR